MVGLFLIIKKQEVMKKVIFRGWKCIVQIGYYENNRLTIWLIGEKGTEYEGQRIATCTVNLPNEELKKGFVHIKEWSENDGMTEDLIKAKIIKPEFTLVPVGPDGSFATLCELNFKPIIS